MSFRSLLVKGALYKVPALKGLTLDLACRANQYAESTTPEQADEARVQLVLAAHALITGARRVDRRATTEDQKEKT